jgi:microsomal dipeptidase-like Zn-dependent dipeptidase
MQIFFLHNHYLPSDFKNTADSVQSVIVPEFYPDLNYYYLGEPCYFTTIEDYINYVIRKGYYSVETVFAIENIDIIKSDNLKNQLLSFNSLRVKILQLFCGKETRFFSKCNGLTTDGKKLLRLMAECGLVLDLSHIPDFYIKDVANNFEGQIIVSHCACSELYLDLCPRSNSLTRNSISFLAERDAIFGISFLNDIVADSPNTIDSSQLFECVIAQLKYFVSLVGVDKTALGPDYIDTNYFSNRFYTSLQFAKELYTLQGIKHLEYNLSGVLSTEGITDVFSNNVTRILKNG